MLNGPAQPDCYSCLALSGERRISPGPTILAGEHWVVEHAYPCGMVGWLVLVLKRHTEALHDLTSAEFSEMGLLIERASHALRREIGCMKEYVACFAEAEHFSHVHVHIVARMKELPPDLKGPSIFNMVKVSEQEAVPPDEIKRFCEQLSAII